MISADSVVIDNNEMMSSESSLTGEPEGIENAHSLFSTNLIIMNVFRMICLLNSIPLYHV
jgi:hypothetical protein